MNVQSKSVPPNAIPDTVLNLITYGERDAYIIIINDEPLLKICQFKKLSEGRQQNFGGAGKATLYLGCRTSSTAFPKGSLVAAVEVSHCQPSKSKLYPVEWMFKTIVVLNDPVPVAGGIRQQKWCMLRQRRPEHCIAVEVICMYDAYIINCPL